MDKVMTCSMKSRPWVGTEINRDVFCFNFCTSWLFNSKIQEAATDANTVIKVSHIRAFTKLEH